MTCRPSYCVGVLRAWWYPWWPTRGTFPLTKRYCTGLRVLPATVVCSLVAHSFALPWLCFFCRVYTAAPLPHPTFMPRVAGLWTTLKSTTTLPTARARTKETLTTAATTMMMTMTSRGVVGESRARGYPRSALSPHPRRWQPSVTPTCTSTLGGTVPAARRWGAGLSRGGPRAACAPPRLLLRCARRVARGAACPCCVVQA